MGLSQRRPQGARLPIMQSKNHSQISVPSPLEPLLLFTRKEVRQEKRISLLSFPEKKVGKEKQASIFTRKEVRQEKRIPHFFHDRKAGKKKTTNMCEYVGGKKNSRHRAT